MSGFWVGAVEGSPRTLYFWSSGFGAQVLGLRASILKLSCFVLPGLKGLGFEFGFRTLA